METPGPTAYNLPSKIDESPGKTMGGRVAAEKTTNL